VGARKGKKKKKSVLKEKTMFWWEPKRVGAEQKKWGEERPVQGNVKIEKGAPCGAFLRKGGGPWRGWKKGKRMGKQQPSLWGTQLEPVRARQRTPRNGELQFGSRPSLMVQSTQDWENSCKS